MQDNTLPTVCTKNEYNNLLKVSTKTKAVFIKTEFFCSRWILEFFQLKLTFLLTVCTNFVSNQGFFHYSRWIQKISIQMQDNTLLTVGTKNEYNNLLLVSTKTKAVYIKTVFLYSQWLLNFFPTETEIFISYPKLEMKNILKKETNHCGMK